MQKLKRVLEVRVNDPKRTIELMQKLSEFGLNIIADSRPGSVKIRIYGSKDEIREVTHEIRKFISGKAEG